LEFHNRHDAALTYHNLGAAVSWQQLTGGFDGNDVGFLRAERDIDAEAYGENSIRSTTGVSRTN
jgi:hypothetical protein